MPSALESGYAGPQVLAMRIGRAWGREELRLLSACVSRERAWKAARFRHAKEAAASLLGEALLLHGLGWPPLREVRFTTNPFGKPALSGGGPEFNISHADGLVACALDACPVGIDVERIRPLDLNLAERCFSLDERRRLFACPEEDRLGLFFSIWCAKESFIKAEGLGLSLPLESFTALPEGDAVALGGKADDRYWRIRFQDAGPDHRLALCCRAGRRHPRAEFLPLQEFLRRAAGKRPDAVGTGA
jgi:4'-phosphopantetheinyl transferase